MKKQRLFHKYFCFLIVSILVFSLFLPSCSGGALVDEGEEEEEELFIPTTTVEVIEDIEYGRVGDISLLLDIYIPETPIIMPMPAVLFIHGGGWKDGDKAWGFEPSMSLAEHGFFVISINYRLSGTAKFPAHVEDSKCAVRWLRANATKYDVDSERIGVWGRSAGGHLAMMIACADETANLEGNGGWAELSSRVQAVCSFYGPTDLLSTYRKTEEKLGSVPDDTPLVQFLGCHPDENPDLWETVDPIKHVTADDPPLLLVHGELDSTVPITKSEQMYEAYQQLGLEVTFVRVSEGVHGFRKETSNPITPSFDEIEQIVLDFFIKHLVVSR